MSIYRGVGGSGESLSDVSVNLISTYSQIASTKAAEADASAAEAAASALAAADTYDNFDDRYLGAKSVEPTLDNDGNALLAGALYWDTVYSTMKVWNTVTWQSVSSGSGAGAVGGGGDQVFYENDIVVHSNYTITTNKNAMSAGPITVDSGVVVTVPSGSTYTIV